MLIYNWFILVIFIIIFINDIKGNLLFKFCLLKSILGMLIGTNQACHYYFDKLNI